MVVVQSTPLRGNSPFYARFAHHSWVDLKPEGWSEWIRVELKRFKGVEVGMVGCEEFHWDLRYGHETEVLAVYRGASAEALIPKILSHAQRQARYEDGLVLDAEHPELFVASFGSGLINFRPWTREYFSVPGPNSNTFIASMIDATAGLALELDHNAVGKDYSSGIRLGATAPGFGWEVDCPYLGLGIGLKQGVELHLFGLTCGVGLWPPAVKISFLPRLGVHPGWTRCGELLPNTAREVRRRGAPGSTDAPSAKTAPSDSARPAALPST
jgi:hypothetical protein